MKFEESNTFKVLQEIKKALNDEDYTHCFDCHTSQDMCHCSDEEIMRSTKEVE